MNNRGPEGDRDQVLSFLSDHIGSVANSRPDPCVLFQPCKAVATRSVMMVQIYAAWVIVQANAGCPRPTGIEVVL